MPADTTVKYFHSGLTGAPTLSGTAGSLISVLDACLVDGFGLKSVDSLVVAGNVATLNISTGHAFEVDSVVLVAGASPAGLNGQHRITSITGTSASFATTGIADQTATGTITAKLAPAGWSKAFSGTNLAAYRQIDPASSGHYLRVDDTGAQIGRLVGYRAMTDISTGTDPFPTTAQVSGGAYAPKSSAASSATRNWVIVADARAVYICLAPNSSHPNSYTSLFFGDFISKKVGDAYGVALFAETANNATSNNPGGQAGNVAFCSGAAAAGAWLSRDYAGLATSLASGLRIAGTLTSEMSGGPNYPAYPSPVDGVLPTTRFEVKEGTASNGTYARGEMPGFLSASCYFAAGVIPSKAKITAEGALAGRVLLPLEFNSSGTPYRFFLDISGPWR